MTEEMQRDKAAKPRGRGGQDKRKTVVTLVVGLVVVLLLSVLFMGAIGGWFDGVVVKIDTDYVCSDECDDEFIDIDAVGYEDLILNKKSFVVMVDQDGCVTADQVMEFAREYAQNKEIKIYKIMFEEMKKTSLYDKVSFYPSVAVISKGVPVVWLRADADEDVMMYNDSEVFREWLDKYIIK